MKLKSIVVALGACIVIVVLAHGAFFYLLLDPLNLRAPSDQKLLEVFYRSRVDLDRLGIMISEDQSKEWYFSTSTLNGRMLGESRATEYTTLLSRVYPGLVATIDYHHIVRFSFASGGVLVGWQKGIEYLTSGSQPDGRLAFSLDDKRKAAAGEYLRPVDSTWYLFYRRLDD